MHLSKCRPQKLTFQTFDTSLYSPTHPTNLILIGKIPMENTLVGDLRLWRPSSTQQCKEGKRRPVEAKITSRGQLQKERKTH